MSGIRETPARGIGALTPRAVTVPALVALAFLVVPLLALVSRVQWTSFWSDVTSPQAVQALGLSLGTGAAATGLCVAFGVPLALLIARTGRRRASVLRAIVTVPLVLPPMVGGVALLYLFGRTGWIGAPLAAAGIPLPFTTAAVVLAQTFVALPFLVLSVEGALRATGTALEETAAGLGAGRWTILWRVTLPLAAPGLVAGVVLSFARAIGEFGATALFAGNAPGVTQTMPLAIYTAFNGAGVSTSTAAALSILLLATAMIVLLAARGWRAGGIR